MDLDPKSADARVALANYEWATGDTKAAEAALRATLGMAPQNPDAHRAMALLYLTTKRAKLAEPHFQALATDPRGKLALADYYLGTAQEAAARRVLDELAAGDNKAHSRAARLRLATLAYSAGRKPEAHRIIDEILAEHPRSVEARNAKARMLLDEGSVQEAAEAARTAITFDAGSVAAHYTLGLTAIARERFDEAEREFSKVVELNPRAGAAQIQLARLGLAAGDAEARPPGCSEGGRSHTGGSGSHRYYSPAASARKASSRRLTRRSPPKSAGSRIPPGSTWSSAGSCWIGAIRPARGSRSPRRSDWRPPRSKHARAS